MHVDTLGTTYVACSGENSEVNASTCSMNMLWMACMAVQVGPGHCHHRVDTLEKASPQGPSSSALLRRVSTVGTLI